MSIVFVVGLVLGIIFASGNLNASEEIEQTNTYVIIIVNSNFVKVFFRLMLNTFLLCIALLLCSLSKFFNHLKFVCVFACGFLLGSYIVQAFALLGVFAIIIILLYFIPEQLINVLAIFISYCQVDECTVVIVDKFDFIRHNFEVIIVLVISYFARILVVFSILQIFLAII